MQTILEILKQAGGWHHGLTLKIENPPHVALVIDAVDESGPRGLPALSVAHYANALAMPEMCFELGPAEGLLLNPFYYRNDYYGVEQSSRAIENNDYTCLVSLLEQHKRLAERWDLNLRSQNFVEAFRRQQTPRP